MSTARGTGLKFLQWTIRGFQFCCSVIVLGVYSYFLATMVNHGRDVPNWVKAIEGISAIGTIYTLFGLLLVCCLSGHPFPSFVSMVIDGAFVAAFVYVAIANRVGAGTCTGDGLDTVYGTGDEDATPDMGDAATKIPTFGLTCRMETACFAVSIIAAFFFIISPFMEIVLNRHRYRANRPRKQNRAIEESRYGPAASDYYGRGVGHGGFAQTTDQPQRKGFLGIFGRNRRQEEPLVYKDPNMLPAHPGPRDMTEVPIMGRVSSLRDPHFSSDVLAFNDGGEPVRPEPVRITSKTAPRPAAGEYNEGEISPEDYVMDPEIAEKQVEEQQEMGKKRKHQRKAAIDRYYNA